MTSFSYGNFGRNVLRSSPVKTVDFSRGEAFNILNIANYSAPSGTTIGVAGAGRVTQLATLPRTLQIGLRFQF